MFDFYLWWLALPQEGFVLHPIVCVDYRLNLSAFIFFSVRVRNFLGQWSTYFPNGKSSADNKNTVEQVIISKGSLPDLGTSFEVIVKGTTVTQGPQQYALVVTGDFDSTGGVKCSDVLCCFP